MYYLYGQVQILHLAYVLTNSVYGLMAIKAWDIREFSTFCFSTSKYYNIGLARVL